MWCLGLGVNKSLEIQAVVRLACRAAGFGCRKAWICKLQLMLGPGTLEMLKDKYVLSVFGSWKGKFW